VQFLVTLLGYGFAVGTLLMIGSIALFTCISQVEAFSNIKVVSISGSPSFFSYLLAWFCAGGLGTLYCLFKLIWRKTEEKR
jgi:hypothetical protein